MKKLLLFGALAFGLNSFGQDWGQHLNSIERYPIPISDGGYMSCCEYPSIHLTICESGQIICDFSISLDENNSLESKGSWFEINENTVDKNYAGPLAWYNVTLSDGSIVEVYVAPNGYDLLFYNKVSKEFITLGTPG